MAHYAFERELLVDVLTHLGMRVSQLPTGAAVPSDMDVVLIAGPANSEEHPAIELPKDRPGQAAPVCVSVTSEPPCDEPAGALIFGVALRRGEGFNKFVVQGLR